MAPIRPSGTGEDGYTLVELLVVIAVIGLLLAATPTLLSAGLPGIRSLSAARAFALDLRTARSAALARGIETRVVIDQNKQSYRILPGNVEKRLPYGVGFSVAARDAAEIDFFPDGSARGDTVTVGKMHRVSIDWLTGRITIDE
ncbi:MAG TPA: GspH/FimT family pseudopilin [Rhizomicrobium sp.]|jgi:general secretion pathway protein H